MKSYIAIEGPIGVGKTTLVKFLRAKGSGNDFGRFDNLSSVIFIGQAERRIPRADVFPVSRFQQQVAVSKTGKRLAPGLRLPFRQRQDLRLPEPG